MKSPFKASTLAGLTQKAEPVRTVKARRARNPDKGKVSCTFNMSPELYRKMQEIKLERGASLQGLLEEAVDVWLASIGETGVKQKGPVR